MDKITITLNREEALMNIQKTIVVALMGWILLIGFGTGSALAATASCEEAKIHAVGYYPGHKDESIGRSGYRVQLECLDTNPSFSGVKSFYLSTDQGESGYATILTAYSLAKTLRVYLGGPSSGSLLFNIYLNI